MKSSLRKPWTRPPTVLDRIDKLSKEEIKILVEKKISVQLKRDGPHASEINGYTECYIIKAETRGGRVFFWVSLKSKSLPLKLELSESDLDVFGARISIYQNKS